MWGAAIVVVVAGLAWWTTREAPSQVLYRAGRELQTRGDRAAAIERYQQALAADPSRVEIRFFLGQALLAERRVADAIPHLNAAVTAGVRPDAAPFELARALASTGQYEAAGIARAPAEAGLHLNLAVALAQDGRMADARARVADALRLRPGYPQARALAERLAN